MKIQRRTDEGKPTIWHWHHASMQKALIACYRKSPTGRKATSHWEMVERWSR
jgi:hypothetical protein